MQWQCYHKRFNGENCVLCTCERKHFPWSEYVGCTYERKRLAGTDCVGCTCDQKQFHWYNCIFSSTVHITVFERSPVAYASFCRACVPGGHIPDSFWVVWEGTPLSPSLTRRRFQMPSRKGVKNRFYSTDAYQCMYLTLRNQ